MIKNNRIDTLVSKTKNIDTLLDIGCDHGLVIKNAIDKNYIKKAIAADLNISPLQSAKNNLEGYPVEFILSDGFKNINQTFDGVVIAGMGSTLISNILNDAPSGDITYILQANNKYDYLRNYLSQNNYKIIDETIVFDKHFYVIITAVRGFQKLTEEEKYLGPILMNNLSSLEYYKYLLSNYEFIKNENKTVSKEIETKMILLKTIIKTLKD